MSIKKSIYTKFSEFILESKTVPKYTSFSELTKDDIVDMATYAISNDPFLYMDLDNTDEAIQKLVDDFTALLQDEYPMGFKNTPNILTLYRIVKLDSVDKLNRKNIGYSWFSNPEQVNDRYFMDMLFHPKDTDLYLLEAMIPLSNVDILSSLIQRSKIYAENEVVLLDDSNIKINNITKIR